VAHAGEPALREHENPQDERADNNIKAEKAADLIRKQLLEQKAEIQAVLQQPRNKL
jgi:hypothetical protein